MNLLLDQLPDHLEIDGQQYRIKTNFRDWIKFENVMLNQKASDMDKVIMIDNIFIDKPVSLNHVIEKLIGFYQCYEQGKCKGKKSLSTKRIYDYEFDQFLIYTAFLQFYKIDLNQIKYMHWWTFRQLFLELPEESKIKKVMMYRSIHINSKMSKEQRRFYAEMKSIYALPDDRTEKQKAVSFGSILAGGMNIK